MFYCFPQRWGARHSVGYFRPKYDLKEGQAGGLSVNIILTSRYLDLDGDISITSILGRYLLSCHHYRATASHILEQLYKVLSISDI